jgi:predicted dehydrogenase
MAEQLAERFAIEQSFDDVDALLRDAQPDVVHVTTPPLSHLELTRKCLSAGCHIYVEKPFSVDLEEAQEMVALAQSRNLKLTAGHNVQFSPEMVQMRELVRGGAVGQPLHMESVFSYSLGDPSYVRAILGDDSHWVRALPGELLQNLISHGIAKMVEFLEDGVTVTTRGFTSPTLLQLGEKDIIDELRVLISDRMGRTANFTFTTQLSPPIQCFRLFGSKGALEVDNLHRTVLHFNRANSNFKSYANFFIPPAKTAGQYARAVWHNVAAFLRTDFHMDAGMKNLIEGFYRSIQLDHPLPISYREILLTASIMDDIFNQLSSGSDNLRKSELSTRSR